MEQICACWVVLYEGRLGLVDPEETMVRDFVFGWSGACLYVCVYVYEYYMCVWGRVGPLDPEEMLVRCTLF